MVTKKQAIENAKAYGVQMSHKVDKTQHERKALIIISDLLDNMKVSNEQPTQTEETQ